MPTIRRKSIALVAIIIAAFAVLIWIQVAFLRRAYELELASFRQNANAALASVIRKLETREMWAIAVRTAPGDTAAANRFVMMCSTRGESAGSDVRATTAGPRAAAPGDTPGAKESRRIDIVIVDSLGTRLDTTILRESIVRGYGFGFRVNDSGQAVGRLRVLTDSLLAVCPPGRAPGAAPGDSAARSAQRELFVRMVLDDLDESADLRITDRVRAVPLDSLVRATLDEHGIDTPHAFGILLGAGDSLVVAEPSSYRAQLERSPFRSRLFPHDLTSRNDMLVLYFPRQGAYILRQVSFFTIVSLLCIAVIAAAFASSARALIRQRRTAERLTSFINNMTHEFKTPLATISIAGENLAVFDAERDADKARRYGRIIGAEADRMKTQVERILEIAALEEGRIDLSLDSLDAHELIEEVVEQFGVRLESTGGSIETDLSARRTEVEADDVHLRSVIHNLLDNALKYTRRPPRISVSTRSEGDRIVIAVADNGIGIEPRDLALIFEKYYRVPTGDVHDVKGFGLGLAYVKMAVESHGGSVTARSVPGEGSVFEIALPLAAAEAPPEREEG